MAATRPPRLTPRDRARHKTNLVVTGILFGAICIALLGFASLTVIGNLAWDDSSPEADATPSPSLTATGTPIRWTLHGHACRDGWNSPSIGERGACSHHGGVVTIYTSTTGDYYTTCDMAKYRPRTLERARELADSAGWVGCTVTPYGETSPQTVGGS